ncbi:flagellar motor protein MotB [Lachnospiraceae bacterium 42-17]|jgi:chemotaxis protein MotB|nr:flagellar motor protein MotB [Dorea sp.]
MGKRKKAEEGGANWMDTYGDLVTLLLCFFVLLYSISTVDQAKWIKIVKSFNPDAKEVSQIVDGETMEGEDDVPGGLDNEGEDLTLDEFDELFESLKQAVAEAGLESEVELFKGDGYTFITFRDNVFFDGDSSVIKEGGQTILGQFSAIISGVSDSVKEIQVLGHTTQADPNVINEPIGDRVLSSERAARVAAFIQTRTNVLPESIVSIGYGQFRPIAPFDTEENRAKNRRVELLITKSDSVEQSLEKYYEEMGRQ